ncbi:non-homologous end-joining DNA ligase [Streptomyces sp. NPDC006706]|uniref:non-homologous end-joining DNA ligase n=1 Tax=Streptomyces sp. NPDC006706 TaxID=3364761 RepID=UPI003677A2D0
MTTAEIQAGNRTVEIKRADKDMFPEDGITKADLAGYHRRVSRRILPHLRGRPLMLERYPDGIDGGRFMQKDTPDHFPDWIHRCELPKEDGTVTYPVCDDLASLLYLVDQACITPHRWPSKADRPDNPDRLVFDLDPPAGDFAPVRKAAALLRELLDELGLPSGLMTTGSRGLHVLVPLDRRAGFDEVRAFARDVAELLAGRYPDQLTTAPRKQARKGRLYLDVQRNAYAQISVTPYAVRALPGAPVATPLSWTELDDPDLGPQRWSLTALDARLKDDDPWQPALSRGHALGPARRKLEGI